MFKLFKVKPVKFDSDDIRKEVKDRALNRVVEKAKNTKAGSKKSKVTEVLLDLPETKSTPKFDAMQELAKILKELKNVDNEKVDTLRRLFLFLDNEGKGFNRKDLIEFLKKDNTKSRKKKMINVIVTK